MEPCIYFTFPFIKISQVDQYNAKGRRPPENLEEELYDDDMEEEEEIIELDKKYNHGQMQLEADEENVKLFCSIH